MAELSMLNGLVETSRIAGLLDDVAPLETAIVPSMPSFPVPLVNTAPSLKRWSVGTLPLKRFLSGVNGANATDHEPPRPERAEAEDSGEVDLPTERRTLPTGAVPLRTFLAAVNWANATEAPSLPTFARLRAATVVVVTRSPQPPQRRFRREGRLGLRVAPAQFAQGIARPDAF